MAPGVTLVPSPGVTPAPPRDHRGPPPRGHLAPSWGHPGPPPGVTVRPLPGRIHLGFCTASSPYLCVQCVLLVPKKRGHVSFNSASP